MNYANIKHHDVANGPGIRVSLFVSGCTHHCKGCFNAEAWSFTYGEPFTQQTVEEILLALQPAYIQGLSLLGGEPFEPENQPAVLDLVRQVRAAYPEKDIWAYSGYTLEQLQPLAPELLAQITLLVDGPFVESQKDLRLAFRGSANQRILDVPASLKRGEPVFWKENP